MRAHNNRFFSLHSKVLMKKGNAYFGCKAERNLFKWTLKGPCSEHMTYASSSQGRSVDEKDGWTPGV